MQSLLIPIAFVMAAAHLRFKNPRFAGLNAMAERLLSPQNYIGPN